MSLFFFTLTVTAPVSFIFYMFSAGVGSPDQLLQVMVPIVSNEVCNRPESYDGQITDTMVCAGYEEGGKDSCQVYSIQLHTSMDRNNNRPITDSIHESERLLQRVQT